MQFNNKCIRNFFIPVCILSITLVLGSCKKLVEVDRPVNTITVDEVFSSRDQANSVVAGMYSALASNTGNIVFSNGGITRYAGLSSDEMANLGDVNEAGAYQFYTNQLVKENSEISTIMWAPMYKVIYSANTVINQLANTPSNQVDDSTKKVLTGEARFIRAFCYFYLTNLYGDVPLVLTTDFTQTSTMAKTPRATVYSQIEEDLITAKGLLRSDYTVSGGERVRVNKYAATALLARVYLYEQKWADAEAQANEVIASSLYNLPTDLTTVFLKNSQESIFQLQINATVTPFNITWDGAKFIPDVQYTSLDAANKAALYLDLTTFNQLLTLLVPSYYLTNKYVSAFEGGDKRKQKWIDSCASPAGSPYNGATYFWPYKYRAHAGSAGAAITEYYMVFRLAEQYLIRAEARAQQGTNLTGAADDINKIRTRAGLTNTIAASKDDLIAAVAHERQTELFAEWGHRWFDLKRTGKAEEVLSAIPYKQPWSNNYLLYPIPALNVTNDPNLIQNDGY